MIIFFAYFLPFFSLVFVSSAHSFPFRPSFVSQKFAKYGLQQSHKERPKCFLFQWCSICELPALLFCNWFCLLAADAYPWKDICISQPGDVHVFMYPTCDMQGILLCMLGTTSASIPFFFPLLPTILVFLLFLLVFLFFLFTSRGLASQRVMIFQLFFLEGRGSFIPGNKQSVLL
jgi:hypothetical protein